MRHIFNKNQGMKVHRSMADEGEGISTKSVLEYQKIITTSSGHCWIFVFPPETENQSLSSIPTKIDQIWKAGVNWQRI